MRGEQEQAGLRTVPVELGSHYLADGWTQKLMPFDRFLDQHVVHAAEAAAAAAAAAAAKGRGGARGAHGMYPSPLTRYSL